MTLDLCASLLLTERLQDDSLSPEPMDQDVLNLSEPKFVRR